MHIIKNNAKIQSLKDYYKNEYNIILNNRVRKSLY